MGAIARIPAAIWADDDFRALERWPQWAFLLVATQPEMDAAGMLPFRPHRWANLASGVGARDVEEWLDELASHGWLELDLATEEVYVPLFFEWERIGSQPRRVVAAVDAMAKWHSQTLRSSAALDLQVEIDAACRKAPPSGVRAQVLLRDGHRCCACGWQPGNPVPTKNGRAVYRGLEIDHIHPKSKGGSDNPSNLQILCSSCNASKGAKVPAVRGAQ